MARLGALGREPREFRELLVHVQSRDLGSTKVETQVLGVVVGAFGDRWVEFDGGEAVHGSDLIEARQTEADGALVDDW
jgi:hypothetical protein